jgi:hypothetical protein
MKAKSPKPLNDISKKKESWPLWKKILVPCCIFLTVVLSIFLGLEMKKTIILEREKIILENEKKQLVQRIEEMQTQTHFEYVFSEGDAKISSIKEGNQGQSAGSVDSNDTLRFLKILQNKNQNNKNIFFQNFDQNESIPDLTGGICSALAFEFALKTLKHKNDHNWLEHSTVCKDTICDLLHYRSLQTALNQIRVKDVTSKSVDFSSEKVHALGKVFDIDVQPRFKQKIFPMLPLLNEKYKNLRTLERVVEHLPLNSVSLARFIKISENEKQEIRGHSCIFVKSQLGYDGIRFSLYNPNVGVQVIEIKNVRDNESLYENLSVLFFKNFEKKR